jgi:acetyl-CoA carboxylase alpha subunit
MEAFFDFEKPIVNLEKKLQDLRELALQEGVDFANEITILEKKMSTLIDETYAKLGPWQRVQLALILVTILISFFQISWSSKEIGHLEMTKPS